MPAAQLKLDGLEAVASKYGPDLIRAQIVAEFLGMKGETVNSDMVREAFRDNYGRELRIGNAMGALFRDDPHWVCVGFAKSTRKQSQGRVIAQWRLKEPLCNRQNS
jgi:hypothetical protein